MGSDNTLQQERIFLADPEGDVKERQARGNKKSRKEILSYALTLAQGPQANWSIGEVIEKGQLRGNREIAVHASAEGAAARGVGSVVVQGDLRAAYGDDVVADRVKLLGYWKLSKKIEDGKVMFFVIERNLRSVKLVALRRSDDILQSGLAIRDRDWGVMSET